jgi:hypothetical protein
MIAGKPPKGSFRMVCNMLEAAFVSMENISSTTRFHNFTDNNIPSVYDS